MTSPFEIFRTPITLRRYSAGSLVNGRWVQGTPTDSTITASIQPVTGEEMQSLPEGRRDSEHYKMFTSTLIETVQGSGTDLNADRVLFFSKEFEVYRVEPWQNNSNFGVVNHYAYIVARVQ